VRFQHLAWWQPPEVKGLYFLLLTRGSNNRKPLRGAFAILLLVLLMSGCASAHKKAWDRYEEGMLLVFKGYDPSQDKEDKIEKLYIQALDYNPKLPGVNASLGTYKAGKGDTQSASVFWEKEVTLHADATKAMALILDKAKKEKEKKQTVDEPQQNK
jgi:hypothetical protein